MERQRVIRYSEAFKLQVLREMEAGKYRSCAAAAEAYGVRGTATVQNWVQRYGREHLLRKVVRVETTEERNELKRLKERVQELERALADAHLDAKLGEAYMRLACKAGGLGEVEEFKKKHAGMR